MNETISYYQGTYNPNHWAMEPCLLNELKVIAHITILGKLYAAYLNPMDKRGFRTIVRLIDLENMASTFNRPFEYKEKLGLAIVAESVRTAYSRIMPIAQLAAAGNNSQRFDPETRVTHIGTEQEPSFLHYHVFGRGDPKGLFFDGVQLDGPIPGLNFDMMAKTPNQAGNEVKVPWGEGEMKKVADCLKIELTNAVDEHNKLMKGQGINGMNMIIAV